MRPGEICAGRFEILGLAGSGGMGQVYRARDRANGALVALKITHARREPAGNQGPEERLFREAEAIASIGHPGIVQYVAHGHTAEGAAFLAMEWLEGEDLSARLAREPLTIHETLALAARTAGALAAAHAIGIVHRDVKPSNLLLVGGDPRAVKVVDFGIARLGAPAGTRAGVTLGTPGYMAPEQARGERAIDARADVFSLGCVMFECLAGKPAFSGNHAMAILAKILLEDAPRASDLAPGVPAALDDLVARMLSKDPASRPRDGAAVAEAIAALPPIDEAELSARPSRRDPVLTGHEQRLIAAVLVSLGPADREAETVNEGDGGDALDALARIASAHGGRVESLANGGAIAIFSGVGAATDLAQKAVRAATAMRAARPSAPIAIATGRGVLAERWPTGEVIDRAVKLVALPPGLPAVRADDLTAGLVASRFAIDRDEHGALISEQGASEGPRSMRALPFVGRERESAFLDDLFDGCVEDPGARVALVTAPAGAGKSRLVTELTARIRSRSQDAAIWVSRGDPMQAGAPFGMLAPMIRDVAGLGDGREARADLVRFLAGRTTRADAEQVAVFLAELIGEGGGEEPSPAVARKLAAARADPRIMGDQLRRAVEDLIAIETDDKPLVIVLDDLHWGDRPSIDALDAALRNLADRPLFVVAAARPEVHALFPGIFRERALQEMKLGELTRKGAEKLARVMLGGAASAEVIERVITRAAGNAFYLEELLRAARAGRGDELPETVLAMASARFEALDAPSRRLLRAASVFGQVFWDAAALSLVAGVTDTLDLRDRLEELQRREIVVPRAGSRFPGERERAFRHALLRDAAYATLTDRDRALGHKLAAEWLTRAGEREAAVLAEHHARAGDPERAAAAYQRAAEKALGASDLASAIAFADRALNVGRDPAFAGRSITIGITPGDRGAMRLIQAEAHGWRGEMTEAEAASREAVSLLVEGSAAWCKAAGELSVALTKLGRYADLEALLGVVLAQGKAHEVEAHHVSLWARLSSMLFTAGRRADAERALDRVSAVDLALLTPADVGRDSASAGRSIARAWVGDARSWSALYRDDLGESLREEEGALAAFEEVGDLRAACFIRVGLGVAYREIGLFAEAERALRDAHAEASRLGLGRVRATAAHNLGIVVADHGAIAEGRALEEASILAFDAEKDHRLGSAARYYLADILMRAGDLDAALREAVRAEEVAAAGGSESSKIPAIATLARVELAMGRIDAALADAERAKRALDAAGGIEEGDVLVRLTHIEALLAAGRGDDAREALAVAAERVQQKADKIREDALRERFLAIPAHVRIRDLMRS